MFAFPGRHRRGMLCLITYGNQACFLPASTHVHTKPCGALTRLAQPEAGFQTAPGMTPHAFCLLMRACNVRHRLCKLAPEVEQTLEDNNVKLVVTFAAPPTDAMQRAGTLFIMLRVDSGMYMVACGGAEGAHPGRHEDNIRKFAQEVGVQDRVACRAAWR